MKFSAGSVIPLVLEQYDALGNGVDAVDSGGTGLIYIQRHSDLLYWDDVSLTWSPTLTWNVMVETDATSLPGQWVYYFSHTTDVQSAYPYEHTEIYTAYAVKGVKPGGLGIPTATILMFQVDFPNNIFRKILMNRQVLGTGELITYDDDDISVLSIQAVLDPNLDLVIPPTGYPANRTRMYPG